MTHRCHSYCTFFLLWVFPCHGIQMLNWPEYWRKVKTLLKTGKVQCQVPLKICPQWSQCVVAVHELPSKCIELKLSANTAKHILTSKVWNKLAYLLLLESMKLTSRFFFRLFFFYSLVKPYSPIMLQFLQIFSNFTLLQTLPDIITIVSHILFSSSSRSPSVFLPFSLWLSSPSLSLFHFLAHKSWKLRSEGWCCGKPWYKVSVKWRVSSTERQENQSTLLPEWFQAPLTLHFLTYFHFIQAVTLMRAAWW